jgi:hypothetical protein
MEQGYPRPAHGDVPLRFSPTDDLELAAHHVGISRPVVDAASRLLVIDAPPLASLRTVHLERSRRCMQWWIDGRNHPTDHGSRADHHNRSNDCDKHFSGH